MGRLFVVAIAVVLGGCAQWSTETRVEEGVFQALHVVDVLQTLAIANHSGCYNEVGDVYEIFSEHPSRTEVLEWGVGYAALHAGVTHLIETHTSTRWPQRVWQAITIVGTANSVRVNWEAGLRLDDATGPIHAKCDPPAAPPANPPAPTPNPWTPMPRTPHIHTTVART